MPRSSRLAECVDCGVRFPSLFHIELENCAQVVRQVLAGNASLPISHERMVIDLVDVLCCELQKSRIKVNDLQQLLRKTNKQVK